MERKILIKLAKFFSQDDIAKTHDIHDFKRYVGQLKKQMGMDDKSASINKQVLDFVKKEVVSLIVASGTKTQELSMILFKMILEMVTKVNQAQEFSLEILNTNSAG